MGVAEPVTGFADILLDRPRRGAVVALCLTFAWPAAAEDKTKPAASIDILCGDIGEAARRYDLPLDYFTRLIWRESRFQRDAVSPAGAQGIAQFMPKTAAGRGLADPFAPREAVLESAAYLSELRATFGNLGLAAAAYNAGPGRLSAWLAGRASLPMETMNYVVAITGHDVSAWTAAVKPSLAEEKGFSCLRFAALTRKTLVPQNDGSFPPTGKNWAVILVGHPQRDGAISVYQGVKNRFSSILGGVQPSVVRRRISGLRVARYIVQIEEDTRADADALCAKMLKAGGACFVLASRG